MLRDHMRENNRRLAKVEKSLEKVYRKLAATEKRLRKLELLDADFSALLNYKKN